MGLVTGLVVYVLLWWWVFFMLLPLGVARTQNPEPGHEPGAPDKPHLWKKALGATVLAGALWFGVDWLIAAELFSFREAARKL